MKWWWWHYDHLEVSATRILLMYLRWRVTIRFAISELCCNSCSVVFVNHWNELNQWNCKYIFRPTTGILTKYKFFHTQIERHSESNIQTVWTWLFSIIWYFWKKSKIWWKKCLSTGSEKSKNKNYSMINCKCVTVNRVSLFFQIIIHVFN